MSNELIKQDDNNAIMMEKIIAEGDLSKLTNTERLSYYHHICTSLNLNPYTRPFEFIRLNGKLCLYARKDATEQLRKIHKISIEKLENNVIEGVYVVTAYARSQDGQCDIGTGAVTIKGLQGDALANAFLKAETKAKRRVTLSICGLGYTDQSEIDSIPSAQTVNVNHETGEIILSEPTMAEMNVFHDFMILIAESANENMLKEVFTKAYKKFKQYPDLAKQLTDEKDKKKLSFNENN